MIHIFVDGVYRAVSVSLVTEVSKLLIIPTALPLKNPLTRELSLEAVT